MNSPDNAPVSMPPVSSRILLSHGISDTPNSVSMLLRYRLAFIAR
jgi:hypothetical protein